MYSKNIKVFEKIRYDFDAAIKDVYQAWATEAKDYFMENFEAGGWEGAEWAVKADGEKATLIKTGALQTALSNIDRNWTRNGKGIRLHLDIDYAPYLNEGTNRMPARPFFIISERLMVRLRQVGNEVLAHRMRR